MCALHGGALLLLGGGHAVQPSERVARGVPLGTDLILSEPRAGFFPPERDGG